MEIQWVGKDILEIQMTGVELEKAIQILDILANDLLSLFLRGLQVLQVKFQQRHKQLGY